MNRGGRVRHRGHADYKVPGAMRGVCTDTTKDEGKLPEREDHYDECHGGKTAPKWQTRVCGLLT